MSFPDSGPMSRGQSPVMSFWDGIRAVVLASSAGRTLAFVVVAHLDLDAFFAAVEELENPELRNKPLIVGGEPQGRGVVATANYVARRFGIYSAMSCAEALRRCPQAVFVPPRHAVYREYSQEVWQTVREVVPTVERTGLDEGYLDLGEIARDFTQATTLAEAVQAAVLTRTRLTCSLGVATSKVVAKVASDRRKPAGLTIVRPGREASFLAPFDIRLLPGVGPRSAERLRSTQVETIGALASLTDDELRAVLPGKVGRLLRDRANGVDPRGLDTKVERISISQEETFARDVADPERLHDELRRMAGQLSRAPVPKAPDRAHRHDQDPLPGLHDPDALRDPPRRHRRRRPDRRARLPAARPGSLRSPRTAATRRGRRLGPGRSPPTHARSRRLNLYRIVTVSCHPPAGDVLP